jgi:hypothetical protein
MLFIKTRSKRSRLAALSLAILLSAAALILAVTAFAAVESVSSPDGSITYENNGITNVTSDTTVRVNFRPGNTVFYSFTPGDAVDVYYNDIPNKPNGSYFPGNQVPTVNGGQVTTIGYVPSAANGGVPLGSDSLITVANPGFEKSRMLIVATYDNGALDGVYTHTFTYAYSLTLEADPNYVDANFDNGSPESIAVTVIVAAYDVNDKLLDLSYNDTSETLVAPNGKLSIRLNKPTGAAYYKAYAWSPGTWIPLLQAETMSAI